jgi:hypothetical protein
VSVLVAVHAANVITRVEVVCVEHLLDWLDALRQEAAHPRVFSLALLTEDPAC